MGGDAGEEHLELVQLAGSHTEPSHCGLLLEHESSILCEPELQMFPITQSQSIENNCQEKVLSQVWRHEVTLPEAEIILQEMPSPRQLPVSESESDRDDDLLIDLP